MPRKSRGWACWAEASGENAWRARWNGAHGTDQQIFLYKADAKEYVEAKRREFQRLDAGLPPLPQAAAARGPAEFLAFKVDHIRWLESRRAAGTVRNVRRAFKLYEEFAGPTFPTIRRRGQHIEPGKTVGDFSDWLLTRPLKSVSAGHRSNGANVVLRHLKAAMRWGYKEGHLSDDPFVNFEFPAKVPVARYLSAAELGALFKEMPDKYRRAAYFTLHTGLRISEVRWADWSGVEHVPGERGKKDKWFLTVIKAKTRRASAGETKTQALHKNALAVMGPVKTTGRIFGVGKREMNEQISGAAKRLQMGRVRWHDLRHTWATDLMQDVKDLKAVMDAGGWVTTTAAMIYQHSTQRRTEATMELRSKVAPPLPTEAEEKDDG